MKNRVYFIFNSNFPYDGTKNRPPQPRFLNSCSHLLSNDKQCVSEKSFMWKKNWTELTGDKSSEKSSIIYFQFKFSI